MIDIQEQEPRVMSRWRALPGCQRLPMALWLVCGGLIALALSTSAYRILFTHQFLLLQEQSYSDSQAIWETLELYSRIFPLLYLAAMAVVMTGLIGLARAPRQHMDGVATWAVLGAVGFGLVILGDALPWFESALLDEHTLSELFYSNYISLALTVLRSAAMALLVIALARMTRAIRAPVQSLLFLLAGVWLAWDLGFSLYRMVSKPATMDSDSPWAMLLVQLSIWAAGLALLAYVAARLAQALNGYSEVSAQDSAREPGALSSPVWDETASGLELYASGLSWRLAVAIIGYALLMFGVLSRSAELMKLVVWLLPVATLATSLIMLAGIRRYARQPDDSPGRTAAALAFVFMLGGVLMDVYAFVLIMQATTADQASYSAVTEARGAAERAAALSVWGMGVGFTSLLILLLSFSQVAQHIGRSDLGKSAGYLAVFLALASVFATGFRLYAPDARIEIGPLIAVAFAVVIIALVAVVRYIRLVADLAAAVREGRSFGDLPAARVV